MAKQRSEGYKVRDINLLEKCLQSAVSCKNCFSRKSKMELYDRPSSKKGLTEEIIIKCSNCHYESSFMTSERCLLN